jgi:hypothetical protein
LADCAVHLQQVRSDYGTIWILVWSIASLSYGSRTTSALIRFIVSRQIRPDAEPTRAGVVGSHSIADANNPVRMDLIALLAIAN